MFVNSLIVKLLKSPQPQRRGLGQSCNSKVEKKNTVFRTGWAPGDELSGMQHRGKRRRLSPGACSGRGFGVHTAGAALCISAARGPALRTTSGGYLPAVDFQFFGKYVFFF